MKTKYYRLRGTKHILDELRGQYIYFAAPDELNDPMEGTRDVFWNGDRIAWFNLLNHYVLCLERLCSIVSLVGEKDTVSTRDIQVFLSKSMLPTERYKTMVSKIQGEFTGDPLMSTFINGLSKKVNNAGRDELTQYLRTIHTFALEVISREYE